MSLIAMAMVAAFAVYVLRTYWWQFEAIWYGTETDAVVSWIDRDVRKAPYTGSYGEFPVSFYYVRFRKQDGLENEARLLNPKKRLLPGDRIRIRYIPTRAEYAVFTEFIEI